MASLTDGEPFSTRETVPTPTPASAATRAMVVPLILPFRLRTGFVEAVPSWQCVKRGARRMLRRHGSDCTTSWWRDGVLYQIYPRSFADSDGDGIGDLRGIMARLDHLEWLGVDGIWLNPTMPSPNDDWGYDVADYCGVHPDLGTLEDLDALVAAAGERGIRVLLDLVPNHTSDRHAVVRRRAAGATRATATTTSGPTRRPTAARRTTGSRTSAARRGSWHEPTGQYYLNNFLPSQPDLNWWNDEVREAFDDILRFWFDARGRRLPDRRLPRDRQGPRAARRPGGDARRPSRGAQARASSRSSR